MVPPTGHIGKLLNHKGVTWLLMKFSNIRAASEKPMRDGKVCPKDRSEPFEKPEITDRLLQLAGVKAY